MPEAIKMEDIVQGVKELREEFEKASPNFAKIDAIEKVLETQEAANQELVKSAKAAEGREAEFKESIEALDKSAKDYKERVDALELEMARGGGSAEKNYQESEEYKALDVYTKSGAFALSPEQKDILRTDNDVQGGFLVMAEMDTMITKKIVEISPIRAVARVRSIGSKSLIMPIRNTIPQAQYEGETEEGPEDTQTYQSETLTAFRQTVTIPITQDLLMDSSFSMESEIMTDAGEGFAQGEGAAFVVGTGFKQPSGFTVDSRVVANARISAVDNTIGFDDMMNLTGDLKTGYNPMYCFNRRTLAFLRTLKGGDGHPLWLPGMNGVVMNTMNGFPYIIANDMPDIANGSIPVAFADFQRGYTIIDRTGMAVIRDDVTQKKKAIIEFTLMRWNTGQVILPEAIKLLQVQ